MGMCRAAVSKEDNEAKTGADIWQNLGSARLGVKTQGDKDT